VVLHPEWHPAARVTHYERHLPRVLGQARHFLTVSEFTRQELIKTLNVPAERVTRVYNGIRAGLTERPPDEVARILKGLHLPPRYLLYVGTIEPRNNLLTLLRAYCSLPDRLRGEWPLLLAGSWGWNVGDVRDYWQREARHRGVVHVGYVAEEHLGAVYGGARALAYPSLYEGVGLPPGEMRACGGAVLGATAGAPGETRGARGPPTRPPH